VRAANPPRPAHSHRKRQVGDGRCRLRFDRSEPGGDIVEPMVVRVELIFNRPDAAW